MYAELEQQRQKIEQALSFYLTSRQYNSTIAEIMQYSVLSSGKRLRPIIMLEIAKVLEKPSDTILPSACSIELIHTASLILDDLPCMDNAKMRRHKTASHLVYGEANTILAAIALILHGLELIQTNAKACNLSIEETHQMMTFIYQRLGLQGMILGQNLDLLNTANTMESIQSINDYKTTSLFEIAVQITGNLCHAELHSIHLFLEYIRNLGRAFQLADDLQDSTANLVGKDSHQDLHKPTYCKKYGIEATQAEIKKYIRQASAAISHFPNIKMLLWLAESIQAQNKPIIF